MTTPLTLEERADNQRLAMAEGMADAGNAIILAVAMHRKLLAYLDKTEPATAQLLREGPQSLDALLRKLVDEWGTLGTLMKLLEPLTVDQKTAVLEAYESNNMGKDHLEDRQPDA